MVDDRADNRQIVGQNGDKNSTKTGKIVLNVAKYLSFYHCYLIFYDVKKWVGYATMNDFASISLSVDISIIDGDWVEGVGLVGGG